jgi:hypothetical protein
MTVLIGWPRHVLDSAYCINFGIFSLIGLVIETVTMAGKEAKSNL